MRLVEKAEEPAAVVGSQLAAADAVEADYSSAISTYDKWDTFAVAETKSANSSCEICGHRVAF